MSTATVAIWRRRWVYLLPILLFAGVGAFLALGLGRDAQKLPSVLLEKPAPSFALKPLEGRDEHGFTRDDLGGQPMLVNIFASWCVPCRAEHPILERLAKEGVVIQGINYKDKPEQARAFLAELGDPYQLVGVDRDGRVAIEWGVYGVPETFILDKDGRIRDKIVGPIHPNQLRDKVLPLLERLGR